MTTEPGKLEIVRAIASDLPEVERLLRRIEEEARPRQRAAPDAAAEGLAAAVGCYDFATSDSFWLLCARVDERFVGYASVVRIPKLDSRLGFLLIDEIYVLDSQRRRGVARALLGEVCSLATGLGYQGIRLLVRAGNGPARTLYRRLGFTEHDPLFCELVL